MTATCCGSEIPTNNLVDIQLSKIHEWPSQTGPGLIMEKTPQAIGPARGCRIQRDAHNSVLNL